MKTLAPPSLRQMVRKGVQAAVAHARLSSPTRAGSGATILMYHSVADGPIRRFIDPAWHLSPRALDRQCAWLARNRTVVSLSALVKTLRSGGRPAPGSVVLTFDDGYLDNLHVAAPILARHELPATLFLATDYVTTGDPQWVDRLYAAFRMRRKQVLDLHGKRYDLTKRAAALSVYHKLSAELMTCHAQDDRSRRLSEIESQLGAAVRLPRLTLDWDDVRTLVERHPSWELGAHGAAHLDYSAEFDDAIGEDLARCMNAIEHETGRVPQHFSFPYGRSSQDAARLVADMGLHSAVAATPNPLVTKDTDVFALGRIDARQSVAQLAFWTAGGWNALPARKERAA